jgi:hypothetical protein
MARYGSKICTIDLVSPALRSIDDTPCDLDIFNFLAIERDH